MLNLIVQRDAGSNPTRAGISSTLLFYIDDLLHDGNERHLQMKSI